jgi:hypothetical protein
MTIYSKVQSSAKNNDLVEALKAYDLWLFLAWLDIRLRYNLA